MAGILNFLLRNMWTKDKGPRIFYVGFLIITLMAAYASMFSFLVEIFGTTTRVFPAIYLSIASVSWGIRGAIPTTIVNVALNFLLYKHTGHVYEGGILGPLGCLFATSLVGIISDLARQLDQQLRHRHSLEAAHKESENRYQRIFNTSSDALLLIDSETGQILEVNDSASKIYGYSHEEFLKIRDIDISAQPDNTRGAVLEQKKLTPLRYHKKKSGMVFPAEITAEHFIMKGRQVHVIAVRDISFRLKAEEERKRLQTQIYQAQKMETIGTLAGGVAHDFNNLLGSIMGHASLGLIKIKPDDPTYEHLTVIERLTHNGEMLTKHLLGFARKGKYEVKATNLNELIPRQNLIFGRTHKHINIVENLGVNLWMVDVDQGQIEQVLFNIYINAVQAMPGNGSVIVTTKNAFLEDTSAFQFPVKPGKYVEVSVRDTGNGMEETTRRKIFEPFFSTKEKGVGTGLGMASVYGIVKNHGGYIHVKSQLGKGATITMLFPCSEKKSSDNECLRKDVLKTGSGTILVVDDEEEMLNVATDMLRTVGYKVLPAKNGREAIALYREKKEEIDLVVLDMIMPDMDGKKTFAKLKEININVKVLVQTGYILDSKKEEDFFEECCGVITKPFSIAKLSERIEMALNPSRNDWIPPTVAKAGGVKKRRPPEATCWINQDVARKTSKLLSSGADHSVRNTSSSYGSYARPSFIP